MCNTCIDEQEASKATEPQISMESVDKGRRLSRASQKWFQAETDLKVGELPPETAKQLRRASGLIGKNGEIRDDFIVKRQSINKPVAALDEIPQLADLSRAHEMTQVDGYVLTQLIVAGYAKMSSKIDELNKINVFPIADGKSNSANLLVAGYLILTSYHFLRRHGCQHESVHQTSQSEFDFGSQPKHCDGHCQLGGRCAFERTRQQWNDSVSLFCQSGRRSP